MDKKFSETALVPVSVVIPCYCCSATIDRAVHSVAQQTRLPHEVILIEDGSPDNGATLERLQQVRSTYAEKFLIQILSLKKNEGAAAARNRGWLAATQPYIAFLDADDAWHQQKLECQYEYMSSHVDVALSGHGCRIGEDSILNAPEIVGPVTARKIGSTRLLLSNSLVTPSVMVRTDIPFRFRNGQRYVDDHLLWLEIVLSGLLAVKLEAPLAFVYKAMYGAGGLSSNMWAMEKAELGNYWFLYKERRITLVTVLALGIFSLAKYVRRLLIVCFRHRKKATKSAGPHFDSHGKNQ